MTGPSHQPSEKPEPPGASEQTRCAFCNDPVTPTAAKRFRAELLCKECVGVAATAQRAPRPASTVAERAAAIDTAAIATNRLALGAVLSILGVGGVCIGAMLVGHFTKDTWESDNAAKIRVLAEEANRLDTGAGQEAALAKYQELIGFVGNREFRDEELKRIVETARDRHRTLESAPAAETARKQEEARRREQAEGDRRRQEQGARAREAEREQRRQDEERRNRDAARQREQERREREAKRKPIEVTDIGLKLVDSSAEMDYCTYSWKATIVNRTSQSLTMTVVLTMYDSEGFELESDYKFGVTIGAGETRTVTGQSMARLSVYNRVDKYGVSLK